MRICRIKVEEDNTPSLEKLDITGNTLTFICTAQQTSSYEIRLKSFNGTEVISYKEIERYIYETTLRLRKF